MDKKENPKDTIDVKRAKQGIKIFKYTFLIVLLGGISAYIVYNYFSPTIFQYFLISVILLGVILFWLSLDAILKAPLKIDIYEDRLHFKYWLNLSSKPARVYFADVKDFQMNGNIKSTIDGRIQLTYLDEQGYIKIANQLEDFMGEPLDIEMPEGASQEQVVESKDFEAVPKEEPEESIEVVRKRKEGVVMWGIMLVLSLLLSIYLLWEGPLTTPLLIVIGLFLFMAFLGGYLFFDNLRKKKIKVDQNGIEKIVQGKTKFKSSWNSLQKVQTYSTPRNAVISFESTDDVGSISVNQYDTDKLRDMFDVVREYANYYKIEIDNQLGW